MNIFDELEYTEKTMTCDAHGEYTARVVDLFGTEQVVGGCPECSRIASEESATAKREAAKRNGEMEFRRVIPRRFHGCTLDGYQATSDKQRRSLAICKKFADRWDDRKAKGGCLVMCGSPGTGKTHLAAAIVREIMPKEIPDSGLMPSSPSVVYVTASEMTRRIKSTYSRDSHETEQSVISEYSGKALLVIDEVGANRGTEAELLLIQEIIDNRYQRVMPTILISNLPEKELAAYIGDRALDRLYDNGGAVIAFDWESKRRG